MSDAVPPAERDQPRTPEEPTPLEAGQSEPAQLESAQLESGLPAGVVPRRGRLRQTVTTSVIIMVLVLLAGGAGAGLYVTSVALPEPLTFPSTTTLYYADGRTVLAELGAVRRYELPAANILETVKQAAVAADDPDFYSDSGGPIARSVARTTFDIGGSDLSVRARVVVVARKLDKQWSKDEVLARYLNNSLFGRLSYGIEAAAREYFGATADKTATGMPQLTTAQAIVLVAMLRQPEADPADPQGSPGYDPSRGSLAAANSRARFVEISSSMVRMQTMTKDEADTLAYPTSIKPYDSTARVAGTSRPVGLVINHVLSELTGDVASALHGKTWSSISGGGLRIVTTIDAGAQAAVEKVADARAAGSVMAGQPATLQAAAVVVEPGTGRVRGYFGGNDGKGTDYAGVYNDEVSHPVGFGAHPPGGAFSVYTLAAALKAGYSLNSYWQWTPHDMPGRQGSAQIRNAGACATDVDRSGACSLLDATVASLDVVFYGLTVSVTPAKVLELARDAGVDTMWTDRHERQDLTAVTGLASMTPSPFEATLGIGQYAVTVLDQANAMATLAAGGRRARAHFVASVTDTSGRTLYQERLPAASQPAILNGQVVADLDYALTRSPGSSLTRGVSAGLAGSWPYAGAPDQNSDAWMVGYTGKVATAVWLGNVKPSQAIKDASGATISGTGLPTKIYRGVMDAVHDAWGLTPQAFPPPALVGTANPPGSVPNPRGAAAS